MFWLSRVFQLVKELLSATDSKLHLKEGKKNTHAHYEASVVNLTAESSLSFHKEWKMCIENGWADDATHRPSKSSSHGSLDTPRVSWK